MDLKDVGCEGVFWSVPAQERK